MRPSGKLLELNLSWKAPTRSYDVLNCFVFVLFPSQWAHCFFRPMQKVKAFRPKSLVSTMTWSLGVIAISLSGALGVKGFAGGFCEASSSVEIPMSS